MQALALWTQGARPAAVGTLGRALTLAAPEGYIRRFVDEGPALRVLLAAPHTSGVAPDYVTRLLAAFGERPPATAKRAEKAPLIPTSAARGAALTELLSERERQVLRLIGAGQSNAEIAWALVIALSTVKIHTNSIFGKLDVTSRTQAIARACDLHLL